MDLKEKCHICGVQERSNWCMIGELIFMQDYEMHQRIVRKVSKVEPCTWKLDSPVFSLENEEHGSEFEGGKEWKEMLEKGDAWHDIRMSGEKVLFVLRSVAAKDMQETRHQRMCGRLWMWEECSGMGGRVRSKDMKGDGRVGFLDGEKMRTFYIKEKGGGKGKML